MPPSRLGLLVISRNGGMITVVEEPVPYRHGRASGAPIVARRICPSQRDLNIGGSSRSPIVTGYREDSLRCAHALAGAVTATGAMRLAELRTTAGVPDAGRILQRNVYAGLPVSNAAPTV